MSPSLPLQAALAALALAAGAAGAAELTPTETRWLRGMAPVLAWADEHRLPLDIVVQPQPTPGLAPLALGFVDGRCKLVLSMRGNPEADATLQRTAPALHGAALELMAAHELAHCLRHVDGAWQRPAPAAGDDAAQVRAMEAERREEAHADLAGLAWIAARRPADYAAVHAWLGAERRRDRLPGSPHDTLAWVEAAATPAAFEAGLPSPFAAAALRAQALHGLR